MQRQATLKFSHLFNRDNFFSLPGLTEYTNEADSLPALTDKNDLEIFLNPDHSYYKNVIALIMQLIDYANQNKLSSQPLLNFIEKININNNDISFFALCSEGIPILARIVKLLHSETVSKNTVYEAIKELIPGFSKCGAGLHTEIVDCYLKLNSNPSYELMHIRRTLSHQLLSTLIRNDLSFYKDGLYQPGNEIHYINAILNYYSDELGIASIRDDYAMVALDEPKIAMIIDQFKSMIQHTLSPAQVIEYILNHLAWENLKNTNSGEETKLLANDLTNRLDFYGIDKLFSMENLFDEILMEDNVYKLNYDAIYTLWLTVALRLDSSEWLSLGANSIEIKLDNQMLLLQPHQDIRFSYVRDKYSIKPFVIYFFEQVSGNHINQISQVIAYLDDNQKRQLGEHLLHLFRVQFEYKFDRFINMHQQEENLILDAIERNKLYTLATHKFINALLNQFSNPELSRLIREHAHNEFCVFLQKFDMTNRLRLYKQIGFSLDVIRNASDLAYYMMAFPDQLPNQRLLNVYLTNIDQLVQFLNILSNSLENGVISLRSLFDSISTATPLNYLMKNCGEFTAVLATLPKSRRLEYIQDVVTMPFVYALPAFNHLSMIEIVRLLPDAERLQFIITNVPAAIIIKNAIPIICEYAMSLNVTQRIAFYEFLKPSFTDILKANPLFLGYFLSSLASDDRLIFLINLGDDLSKILRYQQNVFLSILYVLPINDRFKFISLFRSDYLNIFLTDYNFLNQCIKILNRDDLIDLVLLALIKQPPNKLFHEINVSLQNHILDISFFNDMVDSLGRKDWIEHFVDSIDLGFLINNIKSHDQLVKLVSNLSINAQLPILLKIPNLEQLIFAETQANEILPDLLYLLSRDNIPSFLKFIHLDQHIDYRLLSLLSEDLEEQDKIIALIDSIESSKLIEIISMSDQLLNIFHNLDQKEMLVFLNKLIEGTLIAPSNLGNHLAKLIPNSKTIQNIIGTFAIEAQEEFIKNFAHAIPEETLIQYHDVPSIFNFISTARLKTNLPTLANQGLFSSITTNDTNDTNRKRKNEELNSEPESEQKKPKY